MFSPLSESDQIFGTAQRRVAVVSAAYQECRLGKPEQMVKPRLPRP